MTIFAITVAFLLGAWAGIAALLLMQGARKLNGR